MGTIFFDESSFLNISYYTEMLSHGNVYSNATCFFYKDDEASEDQWYLVTNYHVMTGRHPETHEPLNADAIIPDTLRVYVPYRENEDLEKWETTYYVDFRVVDADDNALWTDLPIGEGGKAHADVAVLPVKIDDPRIRDICSAEEPMNDDVHIELGSDAYVIGFPFGQTGGFLPIWKRASIASHVLIEPEGLPFFYVDTASRSGMSGSPVVYYEKRPIVFVNQSQNQISRHFTKFIGVYSGRIGADSKEGDAQLGRVWRADVISELINRSKASEA